MPRPLLNRLLFGLLLALWPASSGAVLFTVHSTVDAVDSNPGDGACASAADGCTLRAALMETNALPGPDVKEHSAGNYELTIAGTGEDAAATGDLGITGALELVGDGARDTVINAGGLDRVIDVWSGLSETLLGVTITGGKGPFLSVKIIGGAGMSAAGDLAILESVVIANNGSGIVAHADLTVIDATVSDNAGVLGTISLDRLRSDVSC